MLTQVGPRAGCKAGGAGVPDRDRGGELHRRAARQAGPLGDEDVAVDSVNGALAVALDGHRHGQRRRPPQRDLCLAVEAGGDETAHVSALALSGGPQKRGAMRARPVMSVPGVFLPRPRRDGLIGVG